MKQKEKWIDRVRRRLMFFLVLSQALGLLAALMIGSTFDAGFDGYFIGYVLGVFMSFGGTIGFS